jgi:hypothetical protein
VEILSFATALWLVLRLEERRHEMDVVEKPEGAAGERPVTLMRCVAWAAAAFLAIFFAEALPWPVTAVFAALAVYIWLRKAASRARLYRRMSDVNEVASRWFGRRAAIAAAAAEAQSRAREAASIRTEAECRADLLRAWLALH